MGKGMESGGEVREGQRNGEGMREEKRQEWEEEEEGREEERGLAPRFEILAPPLAQSWTRVGSIHPWVQLVGLGHKISRLCWVGLVRVHYQKCLINMHQEWNIFCIICKPFDR